MSNAFREFQAKLRVLFHKRSPELSGQYGEACAENWLKASGYQYAAVEQGKCTLSAKLREFGGKRPDYLVFYKNNTVFFADAKYHSTENCTVFSLTNAELVQYRRLLEFCKLEFEEVEIDMVFMVFPKERDGKRLVWVHLDEFNTGAPATIAGLSATRVSLLDREELWCEVEI